MQAKEWTFIDKSSWPVRGPWDNEPDKAQWTDEATGLACLAVRGRAHWCGYVGVPASHPDYGKPATDIYDVSVHGGLNFASGCDTEFPERGICHIPDPGEPDDLWWFGFDCAHMFDYSPATHQLIADAEKACGIEFLDKKYRDLAYVKAQVASLAEQMAERAKEAQL